MHIIPMHRLALVVSIACLMGITQAQAAVSTPSQGRSYGADHPFTLSELPPGLLRKQLESLPANARSNALKWLHSFNFSTNDLPHMRADKNGGIFFVDQGLPEAAGSTVGTIDPSPVSTPVDAFRLHSKPGAGNVIYLDFDGHMISNTAWNSNGNTLYATPYDLDGNPASFSSAETDAIAEIWRRIAEDYAPFNVDVTTESPSRFGPTTGRLLITRNTDELGQAMPASTAGGVAYVGVWGRTDYASTYSPALVYYNNLGGGRADYVSEAASHEMGHNLGLAHDGTSTSSYYGGLGSGYISWGPIMGTGYSRNVSQWSKGEYPDANQYQDDIAIITGKISLRPDDHGNQTSQATPLLLDASGNLLATSLQDDPGNLAPQNKGIIGSRDDIDTFSFSTAGGLVTIQATPALEPLHTKGGNLDLSLGLYDRYGSPLASSNPEADTVAGISLELVPGTYYLSVSGSGSINYTDYGSLGRYTLSGNIPVMVDNTPPTPDPMGWALVPEAIDHQSIRMTALTAQDDLSTQVSYYFACTAGGNGCTDSGWVGSSGWTATGLDADTSYSFKVKARDGAGNETAFSMVASALTGSAPVINLAPLANPDAATVTTGGTVTIPVLDNDSDPEGDPLTITAVSRPGKGSATTDGTVITYTAGSKRGGDTFTYTIDDGHGHTSTTSVSVSLSGSGGGSGGKGGGKKQ
ncbi:MAG: cadherin-like domain-containing protein [Thiothrix sp.]|nr:cadherin-like domain-containing protein [Thiothrix sp.]HPQ95489.1 Ig-like domain-containing protein [Thiolinea sp.]